MSDKSQQSSTKLTANLKATGCAAKLSSLELKQVLRALPRVSCPQLLAGIDNFEDAAVYKITDELAIVQTIDFFPAVVDDPYLFGQISAANALSDIYAMGGTPILALNVLCFPTCDYPLKVVEEIMQGGLNKVVEAGAVLAGGHSIQSSEPIYGLAVTGTVHPAKMFTNSGAQDGDGMVLSKPLGTGIGLLGLKAGLLSDLASKELLSSLTMLNKRALDISLKFDIHAATDITGFGLIGHVHEMAKASQLTAKIFANQVPILPECIGLAEQGFVPAGSYGNRQSFEAWTSHIKDRDLALTDLLFDPQTSGGLLFSVAKKQTKALVEALKKEGLKANCVGKFTSGKPGFVEVLADAENN
jgi:selenide,water dikinase